MFTELDHNYVNPVSDKNKREINAVFADRKNWVEDFEGSNTEAYGTAYSVFNEYLTWAFFSLYSLDNFPQEDANLYIRKMENQMVSRRHFIRFEEFNQQLIKIYKENKSASVQELYDRIFIWCEKS